MRIGNFRGVCLPGPLLCLDRIGLPVIAERTSGWILLRPTRGGRRSWDDALRATGGEPRQPDEEFSACVGTAADGLAALDR